MGILLLLVAIVVGAGLIAAAVAVTVFAVSRRPARIRATMRTAAPVAMQAPFTYGVRPAPYAGMPATPIDVAGLPGTLTVVRPSDDGLGRRPVLHAWLEVPLGPAWPTLLVTPLTQPVTMNDAEQIGLRPWVHHTGNPAFDGRYRVTCLRGTPAQVSQVLTPPVQQMLLGSDVERIVVHHSVRLECQTKDPHHQNAQIHWMISFVTGLVGSSGLAVHTGPPITELADGTLVPPAVGSA